MRYFTKFLGVMLLGSLLALPCVLAQTWYVEIGSDNETASTNPATPSNLAVAITEANDDNSATNGAETKVIAIRVRRIGGTITSPTGFTSLADTVTFSAYLQENGETNVKATLNFGQESSLATNGQFLRASNLTVGFTKGFDASTVPDPFGVDVANQGDFTITGELTSTAVVIDRLIVDRNLTLAGSASATDQHVLEVRQLEIKSGATLTLGGTKASNTVFPYNLRLPLRKKGILETDGKLNVNEAVINGKIAGLGSIFLAHEITAGATMDPRTYDTDAGTGTDDVEVTPLYHRSSDRYPATRPANWDGGCVWIRGSGEIDVEIRAIAAGNVCIGLSKIKGLTAAGSISNPADAVEGDGTNGAPTGKSLNVGTVDERSPTTDIIFTEDVTVGGALVQHGDARIVFEKDVTLSETLLLARQPRAGDPPVPSSPNATAGDLENTFTAATYGALRSGAGGTVAAPGNDRFVRTTSEATAAKAGVPAVAEGPGPDGDLSTTADNTPAVDAIPAVDATYNACEYDGRRADRGVLYSGVQFEGSATIKKLFTVGADAVTTQSPLVTDLDDDADATAVATANSNARGAVCATRTLFLAPYTGTKDVAIASTLEGGLTITGAGNIHLQGDTLDTEEHVGAHHLNIAGDILFDEDVTESEVDGETVSLITLGRAAVPLTTGSCSGAASLGTGTRVNFTKEGVAVVPPSGSTLAIETVVVEKTLDVQGNGALHATTLHVSDGELNAEGNVQIGSSTTAGSLILSGDGLEGSLHSDSRLKHLVYGNHRSDQVNVGTVDILSFHHGSESRLRLAHSVTAKTVGLCSGTVVLVDEDRTDEDSTLTITEALHVRDGVFVRDSDDPGGLGTDIAKEATGSDRYILRYVTEGERTSALEAFDPRDIVVDHKEADITISTEDELSVHGKVHIVQGTLRISGESGGETLVVGASSVVSDRFLNIHEGSALHAKSVTVHDTLTVDGTLSVAEAVTVAGQSDDKKLYRTGTAVAEIGAKGEVTAATLVLGPNTGGQKKDGLTGDARPEVSLTVNGDLDAGIEIPAGSKRTTITGSIDSLGAVVLTGTATETVKEGGDANWDGTLYLRPGADVLVVDSLGANQGSVEFHGERSRITEDVVLSTATIWAYNDSLTFEGNLEIGGTAGLSTEHNADDRAVVLTVEGDFTQKAGEKGDIAGVKLDPGTTKILEGDFRVASDAIGYELRKGKLVIQGDTTEFGLVKKGYTLLDGTVEFSGSAAQYLSTSAVELGDVLVNNVHGVEIGSDISQGKDSELTLRRGVISGSSSWIVKNTGIEENLVGRSTARRGLYCGDADDPTECGHTILQGSRQSHVTAQLQRHILAGSSGSGAASGGYLFPVGGSDAEGGRFYRPLILQLPNDLVEAQSVSVRPIAVPEGARPSWPATNLLVPAAQGSLTLSAYSGLFWQVEAAEELTSSTNVRVAADGLVNVFDQSGLRIVQWDCDWTNPRLAGTYRLGQAQPAGTLFVNDYVGGVLNLTQEGVDVGTCSILGIAANGLENPIHLEALTGGLSYVQFIHNLNLPVPVNLSVDGLVVRDGLEFQQATGYGVQTAGAHTATILPAGAPAEQAITIPIPVLTPGGSYAVIAHGTLQNSGVKILETRRVPNVENTVEAILVHGNAGLDKVDVRVLDPSDNDRATRSLANNFGFDSHTNYLSLPPGAHNVEVTNEDNSERFAVYRLDLNGYAGQTLILNLSGSTDPARGLMVVDDKGQVSFSQLVTSSEGVELPTEFTLHGNYPNPFNPSTRIEFDLPETSSVRVQVVDMLGREVMALPVREFEAGAKRGVLLDASHLASGTYLYRMVATGAEQEYVKTGRMTLVK